MKRILLIALSIFSAQCVAAQMTLNDCLLYAREHAHSNRISRLEVEKANLNARITASDLMPYVGVSSSGNLSFGRNIDPETNTYDNKKTLSTGFGISMSLPLFDGLVSINNLKAAKVAKLRQMETARIEEDRISLQVVSSFYNVSYCKAMVEQVTRQLERDSIDLLATIRGEALGTKSGADVAEMRALVATDEYELSNQKSLLAKAYLKLKSDMGMQLDDTPLELLETPIDQPENSGALHLSDASIHPKIAEARLQLRESELYLRAAKGAYSPRLSLSGGVSTSYFKMIGDGSSAPSFREQWKNNMGEYIGVSLSIPLFTGLATTNRLKRARINVLESRTRLEQTEYEIEQAISEAELDLQGACDAFTAAVKQLEAQQIAYEAIHRKYELGSASVIDLYTSGVKLATARADLEGKRIQKLVCRITLDYYLGKNLIHNA